MRRHHLLYGLLLTAPGLAGCGSSAEHKGGQYGDPLNETPRFDDLADQPAGACEMQPASPEVFWLLAQRYDDGSCQVTVASVANDDEKWATVCSGNACFCVKDGAAVCACETDGPWCDEPTPSCCPLPFP